MEENKALNMTLEVLKAKVGSVGDNASKISDESFTQNKPTNKIVSFDQSSSSALTSSLDWKKTDGPR
jgi:hypothetical protein